MPAPVRASETKLCRGGPFRGFGRYPAAGDGKACAPPFLVCQAELNRRRLCLRLFVRVKRSSAEGTPSGVSADSRRRVTARPVPLLWCAKLKLNRRRLCLRLFVRVKRSSAEGTPSGVSADTRRQGTAKPVLPLVCPAQIEQAQALPAAVRARERLCRDTLPRLPKGNGKTERSSAEGAPSGVSADTRRRVTTKPVPPFGEPCGIMLIFFGLSGSLSFSEGFRRSARRRSSGLS